MESISKKLTKKKTKRSHPKITFFLAGLLLIGLISLAVTFYIGFRVYTSEKRLIPLAMVALIAGVFFEAWRLTGKWTSVLLTALGALPFSLFIFLKIKKEQQYSFEHFIEIWPYAFLGFFILFIIAIQGEKLTAKLAEGITLLQSMAVIYWAIDYGFVDTENIMLRWLMILGLLLSLFTFYHAFTQTALSRTSRLALSIWSCIIMVLFAIDNIYRI